MEKIEKESESTLKWGSNSNNVILIKPSGVQYNLKKDECISFKVENVYDSPQYGDTTIIAKIDNFIGYFGMGVWGIKYSILDEINNVWLDAEKETKKNIKNKLKFQFLSDVHYNDNIWNSIELSDFNLTSLGN